MKILYDEKKYKRAKLISLLLGTLIVVLSLIVLYIVLLSRGIIGGGGIKLPSMGGLYVAIVCALFTLPLYVVFIPNVILFGLLNRERKLNKK